MRSDEQARMAAIGVKGDLSAMEIRSGKRLVMRIDEPEKLEER